MSKKFYILFVGWLILSFTFKLYFPFFTKYLGTIPSDILVSYWFYGHYIFGNFISYPIEYPVGYIIIQKLMGLVSIQILGSSNSVGFFLSHMILAIPSLLIILNLLVKISYILKVNSNKILLYLLISPTFFFAASHNYELYVMMFILLAIFLAFKKHYTFSFVSLALATVIKIYPIFLLPLFIFYLLSKEKRRDLLVKPALMFFLTLLLINSPFLIYSHYFWFNSFLLQYGNIQKFDPNTFSFLFEVLGIGYLRSFLLIFAILVAWVFSYIYYKKRLLSTNNFIYLVYFACISIVFSNQVNTPQYFLWFLPFSLLLGIPGIIILYCFDILNATIFYTLLLLKTPSNYSILLEIYGFIISYFLILYIYSIYILLKKLRKNEKH